MKTDLSALKFNQITVVTVTAVALVLRQPWLAALLGAAMLFGAVNPALSPMKALYRTLGPAFGLKPEIVDETPEAHHFAQASAACSCSRPASAACWAWAP